MCSSYQIGMQLTAKCNCSSRARCTRYAFIKKNCIISIWFTQLNEQSSKSFFIHCSFKGYSYQSSLNFLLCVITYHLSLLTLFCITFVKRTAAWRDKIHRAELCFYLNYFWISHEKINENACFSILFNAICCRSFWKHLSYLFNKFFYQHHFDIKLEFALNARFLFFHKLIFFCKC